MAASATNFLFRSRNTSFDVGSLFDFLTSVLWTIPGVRTNRVDFTLVNVCCPFNGFSHGFCPPPETSALPSGKALVFTFATSAVQSYDLSDAQNVVHVSNFATRWSVTNGTTDFVSISVSLIQAHEWSLNGLQQYQLFYIYNVIGTMTKSVVRRQNSYLLSESYSEIHAGLNLVDVHNKYFMLPLKYLFTKVPNSLWCFNQQIWRKCPNLLMQRQITPQLALFYFMYIAEDLETHANKIGTVFDQRLGYGNKTGICGQLDDSTYNLVQLIRSPGDHVFTASEMLAPIVLLELISRGSNRLTAFSRNYVQEFTQNIIELVENLRTSDVSQLLLPADRTARLLMNKNEGETNTFVANVLNKMKL